MKKIIILLSISIMFAGLLHSQTKTALKKPTPNQNQVKKINPNAPVITFDKVIHNYGNINKGDNGKCEFSFTNTGKEPLILSRPRSNCGCTVPTWPRQPILPGKTEVITVVYDTNRIGPIHKSVTVFSNAKNRAVVLQIRGTVKQKTN